MTVMCPRHILESMASLHPRFHLGIKRHDHDHVFMSCSSAFLVPTSLRFPQHFVAGVPLVVLSLAFTAALLHHAGSEALPADSN